MTDIEKLKILFSPYPSDMLGSSLFQVGNGMKRVYPTLEVLLHYES
jgi:hypothetical protein